MAMSPCLLLFRSCYTPIFHFNNGPQNVFSTVVSSIFPEGELEVVESLIDQTGRAAGLARADLTLVITLDVRLVTRSGLFQVRLLTLSDFLIKVCMGDCCMMDS